MSIEGRVVLASRSPRRKEILQKDLGFRHVSVVPSQFPENLSKEAFAPFEYCVQTATEKALDVYRSEIDADEPPVLLIAADTVVSLQGKIIEKPKGADEHVTMLKALRDSPYPHKVYTGVVAMVPYEQPVAPGYALETYLGDSDVHFRKDITDKEILDYVATGEGRDAAGGYMIQGGAKGFVDRYTGELSNIIGLPIEGTRKLIERTVAMAKDDDLEREDDDEYEVDDEGRLQF